ncbi:hypothetical protein HHL19_34265 [Streptomyces sp. R302]|uniref:hypothetical protein n=1 Tax=unclassified Streptomyces TaxID=2593676 RepID=UPI00145CCBA8|nr:MULTISPECIES: hypothetical protein [unclassified Streptomyces]NML54889.1 hypothetical protein [Streptomyces sp. R301]NML83576.1 hypothetical protein [Streptomyces sp. R302]
MIRNIAGSVLALAGATAAVWSPFRAWYDGRHGSDYAIGDLFTGITGSDPAVIGSILLPFAFAALVTLLGVVLRSRLLVAVAGVIVLGFTVLWMVRVGQAEDGLVVSGDGRGLGDGVANALGGGLLLLLGALVMSGRPKRHRLEPAAARPRTHPTLDEGPPPEPYGTGDGTTDQGTGDPYDTGTRSMPYAAPDRFDVPAEPPRDPNGNPKT